MQTRERVPQSEAPRAELALMRGGRDPAGRGLVRGRGTYRGGVPNLPLL